MKAHFHFALLSACFALAGCEKVDDRGFEYENRLHFSNLLRVDDVNMEISADTRVSGEYRVRIGTESSWFTFVPTRVGKNGESTFIEMSGGFTFFCDPATVGQSELMPKVEESEVDARVPKQIESIKDAFRACQVRATDEVRIYLARYEARH